MPQDRTSSRAPAGQDYAETSRRYKSFFSLVSCSIINPLLLFDICGSYQPVNVYITNNWALIFMRSVKDFVVRYEVAFINA